MEVHGHGQGLVGFRFHPTEEEIITYFLERKMCGLDFPARAVEDVVDVCMYEPWDLPQRSPMPKEDQVWYFFNAPVSKSANNKGINRKTQLGSWKGTGKDRKIWDKQGKEIGFKKNFVFYKGHARNGIRTNWVIHEYHSLKAASYRKEYVLSRLKRKSGDKPDTCNGQSPPLAFDYGNHVTENTNTQINDDIFEELLLDHDMLDHNPLEELLSFEQGISNSNGFDHNTLSLVQPEQGTSNSNGFHHNTLSLVQPEQGTSNSNGFDHNTVSSLLSMVQPEQGITNSNGFDHNTLSSLLSMVQQGQGTLYSDGFNNERSLLNDSYLETSEQEDAFVDSLWADQGECSGEISVNTLLHDFNPTKPLSGVYVGDSSERMPHEQDQLLETSGLFYKNVSSKGYSELPMFRVPNESPSSSDGDEIMELDISSVNSVSDLPGIFFLERVVDELPTNARTCKAQHTPKSRKFFQAQCSQELQSKVSHKAVSNVEMGENFIGMFGKDKQVAQTSRARTSLKSSSSSSSNRSGSSNTKKFHNFRISDGAGSNNRKGSFVSLETPQLSRKTNPPSVYLFNVFVSLVLVIFIIREMVYLH